MDLMSRLAGSLTPTSGYVIAAATAAGTLISVWAAFSAPTRHHNPWSAAVFSALFTWIGGLCATLVIVGLAAAARRGTGSSAAGSWPVGAVAPLLIILAVTVALAMLARIALPIEIPTSIQVAMGCCTFALGAAAMLWLRLASVATGS